METRDVNNERMRIINWVRNEFSFDGTEKGAAETEETEPEAGVESRRPTRARGRARLEKLTRRADGREAPEPERGADGLARARRQG